MSSRKNAFRNLIILLHFLNFCHATPQYFLQSTTTFGTTPADHGWDDHPSPYSKFNDDHRNYPPSPLIDEGLWTKQNLISEIVRNYIHHCGTVAPIVKGQSLDQLRGALDNGDAHDPGFVDHLEIFIDLSVFCNQRDVNSHHVGHPDCFRLPRGPDLQQLMYYYGVYDEHANDRKLACKIHDEMEKDKVGDEDAKQMILDNLAGHEGGMHIHSYNHHPRPMDPMHHQQMPSPSYHPTHMPPMHPQGMLMPVTAMLPQRPSQPYAIRFESSEAAAVLWHMADLLDRISILYYSANLIRVHIKTQNRVKIHNRGLHGYYQMDMRVYAQSLPKDACRILHGKEDVYEFFMLITSSNTGDPQLDFMFTRMKDKTRNIQHYIHMPANTIAGKYNANCIEDLFLLRAMLEFYRSLIKSIQAWISLIKPNDLRSHKTFCDVMQPQCIKNTLNVDLADMKKETDLMIQVIERWFEIELDQYNLMNWKTFRRNHIDDKFHVQIIDTPQNSVPSNMLKKIRQSIFQRRKKPYRPNYVDFVRHRNRMRPQPQQQYPPMMYPEHPYYGDGHYDYE